ncbi:hypothetical protein KTQ74_16110 [Pseudomonas chlororaphis]|uniref:hypothetical protein n=1 Tax=Pseudomonas chlororaphis TaxID=587753 RepID=UPI001E4B8DB5|nr:hypothetical protein [Pseudomonas chlororaphis]MCB2253431.1 hypothetical protein [Pseudomonas chlororaphis]
MRSIQTEGVKMSKKIIPFYIVLFSCVLVVLGDLRNIITPAGYWGLWGGVLCMGCLSSGWKRLKIDWALIGVLLGFTILILSLLLISLTNSDEYTAYQALKYFAIAMITVVIFKSSQALNEKQFYRISMIVTLVGLFFFLLCKYFLIEYYVLLGDGRQGSMFAFPGVLWKTSAFFVSFIIARVFTLPFFKSFPASLLILASIYLLLADSSRTGFLWFSVIIAVFAFLQFLISTNRFVVLASVAVMFISVLVAFNSDAIYEIVTGDSFLVINRLFEGDPIREKMLNDGVVNADVCLPLGCGFGRSTSLVDGAPMVVHNTYLAILGDLGVLGGGGLLMTLISPILLFLSREWRAVGRHTSNIYFRAAACLGVLCFCFVLLFHPLSSEMSEWGYWAIMLSWSSSLSRFKLYKEINNFHGFESQRA